MTKLAPLVLAVSLAAACQRTATSGSVRDDLDVAAEHGARLFAEHCAICHGADGGGQGRAELFPPARNFRTGRFRIVSSANGAPTDGDLLRVLKRGLPGSAMPAFAGLSEVELELLVRHVRELALEGLAQEIEDAARRTGEKVSPEEARELAVERMAPGPVLHAAPFTGAPDLARGRDLYRVECARCHGEDGRGRENVPRVNADGRLDWARDFTAGFLEGGASRDDLWRRIVIGLPGSAMPGASITAPEDLHALVGYVQSLIPPGSETARVQERHTIRAPRVASVDSVAWDSIGATSVVLAPLVWNAESIVEATVAAAHDGERLAVRVSWKDETPDRASPEGDVQSDGCALQLSTAQSPPLFGMGSASAPTNIWHWKAFHFGDVAGLLDQTERPHRVLDDPLREPPAAVDAPYVLLPDPSEAAESIRTTGPDSLGRALRDSFQMQALPRHSGDRWEVVFVRALAPRAEGEVALEPGRRVQLACAVWNGSAGDHDGRKSIGIWHELALEP
jgi:DMSO reductase family type II enzyme heme b subunit